MTAPIYDKPEEEKSILSTQKNISAVMKGLSIE